MILDERTEFIDNFTIPAAGTAIAGDVIDTTIARDIGNGHELFWYTSVGAAAAGGTSVNVQLVSSNAPALTSPVVHAQTGVIPLASLTAGKMIGFFDLPLEGPAYKRYVGIQLVVAGTFTAGTLNSGFTLDKKGWKAYREGLN